MKDMLEKTFTSKITACIAAFMLLAFAVLAPANAFAEQGEDDTTPENEVNETQVPDSSFLYDTSIDDLASANSYYDGQTVQVIGEVVGDRIVEKLDSSYCWITLASQKTTSSQTTSVVSVYMSMTSSHLIDTYGAYNAQGTKLQVRGTFNLACSEHQGVSDIHAEAVSLVQKGAVQHDGFSINALIPGVVLVLVSFVIMGISRVIRERGR